jgi:hypothetical protein
MMALEIAISCAIAVILAMISTSIRELPYSMSCVSTFISPAPKKVNRLACYFCSTGRSAVASAGGIAK